jgi:hypothetical protein
MAKQFTGDDIALYMLKTAEKVRCVEFKGKDFPTTSVETLRTRLYAHKRGNPEYEILRVAVASTFVTVVNPINDDIKVVVTEKDLRDFLLSRLSVQPTKQPISAAELSCSISSATPQIVSAIKTLIEAGIISTFAISGCNSLTFNSTFPNSGLVVKETERGVALY